ncbi:MAG TPA: hypothetical protein VK934_09340 [Fimbriimonas sp.]|nr:hypothetical protein [Fimbriimonas sp.]
MVPESDQTMQQDTQLRLEDKELNGGAGLVHEATTEAGGVAFDGGKLAGHVDDFDGELENRRLRNVPGADPENEVHPPNDRDLRQ